MDFKENVYEELNLYNNFCESATKYPNVPIYFEQELIGFPELKLETTYKGALQAIQKQAARLSRRGIKKGDKVIIYKSPNFDTYMLAVALSYLGAVPAMISYHLPLATMEVIGKRLANSYLIYDRVTKPVASKITSINNDHLIELEDLINDEVDSIPCQDCLELDEISYMTHTSGTTGIPKLIAHSAQSMGWRTKWQRNVFDLLPEQKLVAFHISPVHSRFNIGMTSIMSKGFPLLWIGDARKENIERVLKQYQPYALETHPNNFVQWSRLASEKPELFASINYYHSTFDAINKGTMKTFLQASNAKKPVFMQVYGQSECGPMIMKFHDLKSIEDLNARNMGVGMPDLTEVRIVGEDNKDIGLEQQGKIQMLSKGRALTYYQEDDRFNENTYDLWWDSGDFGYKDENGELYLLDRQIDLIDNIESTLFIEDLLLDRLDFLNEVIIVRGKDDTPQPIISLDEGATMDWDDYWDLVSDFPLLNEPLIWEYDQIPRTATMKVQRLKIEEMLKNE